MTAVVLVKITTESGPCLLIIERFEYRKVACQEALNVIEKQMDRDILKLNRFQAFFYSINTVPSPYSRSFKEINNPIMTSLDFANVKPDSKSFSILLTASKSFFA